MIQIAARSMMLSIFNSFMLNLLVFQIIYDKVDKTFSHGDENVGWDRQANNHAKIWEDSFKIASFKDVSKHAKSSKDSSDNCVDKVRCFDFHEMTSFVFIISKLWLKYIFLVILFLAPDVMTWHDICHVT